jgi:hypothetical protein
LKSRIGTAQNSPAAMASCSVQRGDDAVAQACRNHLLHANHADDFDAELKSIHVVAKQQLKVLQPAGAHWRNKRNVEQDIGMMQLRASELFLLLRSEQARLFDKQRLESTVRFVGSRRSVV